VADWIARGAFLPLDDYLAEDERAGRTDVPRRERYYPACWTSTTYQNRSYGVPIGLANTALLYNKDLLEQAGLVYEDGAKRGQAKPPQTWAELREYSRKLTRREEGANRQLAVIGFSPLHGAGSLELYTHLAGGRLMNAAGDRCLLNSKPAREALGLITDLYDAQGGVAAVRGTNLGHAGSNLDPFIRGRLAMKIDYQYVVNWQAAFRPEMRFGVAPLPTLDPQAGPRSWVTGWQASIPARARNPRGGWALIRFLGSDRGLKLMAEYQRRLTEANGLLFVPAQTPVPELNDRFSAQYVRDNPRLPAEVRRAYDDFQNLLPAGDYPSINPVYNLLASAQTQAAESAVYGAPPAEALRENERVVQTELHRRMSARGESLARAGRLMIGCALFVTAGGLLVVWRYSRGRRGGRWRDAEGRWGLLLASPWLLGFAVFTGGPLLFSLLLSFCDYNVLRDPRWVGLENYRELLTEDRVARRAFANTLFMVLAVPAVLAVSLGLALLVNGPVRFRSAWRAAYYLPVVVPLVASSLAWLWFLNPQGPLNRALAWAGVAGPNWLQDPAWSKPALLIISIWTCGGSMVVWLAGLQTIPKTLYEAAALDGANAWQRFRHVTWPHLAPYFSFNLLAGLIASFQSFGEAFIMTSGGPDQSTLFLNYHLFNSAFQFGRMGYACALAWLLFLLLVGVTTIQFRLVNRRTRREVRVP
jgi:multiple sugar transport system permease protein